ncbi:MAG TPA: serine/threonine-protein kinase [Oculatellaceae cyanobacterium]
MKYRQTEQITLAYDSPGARITTWWKAFMLVPAWFYPLLPILGSLFQLANIADLGFVAIVIWSLSYFANDLLKKRVVINRKEISLGLCHLPVNDIKSIDISQNWFSLPNTLKISARSSSTVLTLKSSSLDADDLQLLVNTLQRMSPSCKVSPVLDETIKYRKTALLSPIQDTSTTAYISYHADRVLENIPNTFVHQLTLWSQYLGPTGTMIVFLPISCMLSSMMYGVMTANWGNVAAHKQFYDTLVPLAINAMIFAVNFAVCGPVMPAVSQALAHPIILTMTLALIVPSIWKILAAISGPNRITMNAEEISIDHWNYFQSFLINRIAWTDVKQVGLDSNSRKIVFRTESNHTLILKADGIDNKDRNKLLHSIKRFAPNCEITPELCELLEPSTEKSYTQLWLQSIAMAPQAAILKPIEEGTSLDGRFEVIRRLGEGGQGVAYLCHDLTDKEQKTAPRVAIKEMLIPPYLSGLVKKSMLERFHAEALLLKSIDSQNVVKLLDYFVDERGAYLVLEHIEGSNLRELVSTQGALTNEKATDLASQMLEILDVLHRKGIVHRDFTPENLILRRDGVLKLIDFNVAQDESEGTTATIVGKHAFVPPEQFRGSPCVQSDLYAFGATLYFLLTGTDPEPITQSALPDQLKSQNPVFNQIIQAATAIDLQDRAKSVADLSALLEAGSEGEPERNFEEQIHVTSIHELDKLSEWVEKTDVAINVINGASKKELKRKLVDV